MDVIYVTGTPICLRGSSRKRSSFTVAGVGGMFMPWLKVIRVNEKCVTTSFLPALLSTTDIIANSMGNKGGASHVDARR